MLMTFSHQLHQLGLHQAQQRARVRWMWLNRRSAINDRRTRELQNVIKYGRSELDDQLRKEMDRLYETRGRAFCGDNDVIPELQRGALNGKLTTQSSDLEKDDSDPVVASVVDIPVLPPRVSNLRQTPRRPGAPSAALPH